MKNIKRLHRRLSRLLKGCLLVVLMSLFLANSALPGNKITNDGQEPDRAALVLKNLRKLMDVYLRDPSICRGPDGYWYLTGTTNPPEGIPLWRSKDLKDWQSLGIIWKPGQSKWHQPYLKQNRPLWAPEIHYINGNFWLTYSMPGWDADNPSHFNGKNSGCGLLRSTTGKAEGPYADVQPNKRMGDEIDASLFRDDDGSVYFLWHSGKIARMKPDMSGLAEPYHWLKPTVADTNPKHHSSLCPVVFGADSLKHVGFEGVFLFKANGLYYLCASDQDENRRYSCYVATSKNIYGPYSARYEALPYCGHNMFFQDETKQWWSTFFGNDGIPWKEQPGILPVTIGKDNAIVPGRKGHVYYIDPLQGNDTNNGLSPASPLKTYTNRDFTGGDTILFKRGSVVRDMLHTQTGHDGAPITYGAYGKGAKPTFMGSMAVGDPEQWAEERPSIWRYKGTFASKVCNLVFNGGERCGNMRWNLSDLKHQGEWHFTGNSTGDADGAKVEPNSVLYLCSSNNPGKAYRDIECVLWGQRKMVGGNENITLENLCFRNSGVHGYQESHVRNVTLRGCEFRFIGGAVWSSEKRIRFGNAVELWDGASNVTVEQCTFDNIYDSGITHQGGETRHIPEKLYFRNNRFSNCGMAAYECREPSQEVYFEGNTCLDAGGGFSMQGEEPPRQSEIYPQPMGHHVFIWRVDRGTQPGHVYIRNNVFGEAPYGAAIYSIIDPVDEQKFIIDNNRYGQTTGDLLFRFGGRMYKPSEFARYQNECTQDKHSKIQAKTPKPYVLWYDKPAPEIPIQYDETNPPNNNPNDYAWENWSLPIGNGYLGANIFGRTVTERVQLTDNTLASRSHYNGPGLTNFAELYIDFNHQNPVGYRRGLRLNDGVAFVEYAQDGTFYEREYFASYPDKVMVVKLKTDRKGALSFTVRPEAPYLREFGKTAVSRGRSGKVTASGDLITLSGNIEFPAIQYEGQFKVIAYGGSTTAENDSNNDHGKINVANADSALIVVAIGTNYKLESRIFTEKDFSKKLEGNEHPHRRLSEIIGQASSKSPQQLYNAHLKDYSNLFSRVKFDLGSAPATLPTDEMLKNYKDGIIDHYLEELYFQYGRYLLICSSRPGTLPPNLQGTWSQYEVTPWTGGYWHNINIQMNYWPVFNTNLTELFQSYVDFNEAFRDEASTIATDYIKNFSPRNVCNSPEGNGWTIGTGANAYSISGPGGHSGPGTGGLTTKLFWDYYEFSGDKKLLKEHCYPALLEMSRFLSKTVIDTLGFLLATPSASPEQRGRNSSGKNEYYITTGCAFDQQMIYENHADVLKAAKILGNNSTLLPVLKMQLPRLDPVQVGSSGQIKEYREEKRYGEIGEYHHRHISNLVGLYPGTLINSNTPAWLDAARITLNERGDQSTGWAMAHRLNLWARIKDGDRAYSLLQTLLRKGTMNNLWDTHPPFQIDGNFGGTAGIAEMLLQSHEGYINPLAALPKSWDKGSFAGLLARGNFEVSAEWENSQATRFAIHSKIGGTCRLKYFNVNEAAISNSSGKKVAVKNRKPDYVEFETSPGETYQVTDIPAYRRVAPPVNLKIKDQLGNGKITLSWDASPDAVAYRVYKHIGNSPDYKLVQSGVKANSFESPISDKEKDEHCILRVTAVDKAGRESEGVNIVTTGLKKTVLILGNSIVRHTPKPDIGWYGDWGMAASVKDSDFVHLLIRDIHKADPSAVVKFANIADFERNFDTYRLSNLDSLRNPDVLILKISENVDDKKATEGDFIRYYGKLVDYIAPKKQTAKVIVEGFWAKENVNRLIEAYANEKKYPFVPISKLSGDSTNTAVGKFEHKGVAAHPSDKGMRMIEQTIWQTIKGLIEK